MTHQKFEELKSLIKANAQGIRANAQWISRNFEMVGRMYEEHGGRLERLEGQLTRVEVGQENSTAATFVPSPRACSASGP